MIRTRNRCLLAAALLAAMAGISAAEVTIYRCTDAQGRLTLRDTPCRKGERQQTREMLRPRDPAPRPPPPHPAPAPVPTVAAPATRVVMVTAPRPLYECVTPDGYAYISDSDGGDPRWLPLWTLGHPLHAPPRRRFDHRRGGLPMVATPRTLDGRLPAGPVFDNVGRPTPKPPRDHPGAPRLPPAAGIVFAPGAWVRDDCQALPQQEICDRLRDRRFELDRRYNSALQSERAQISNEQRGIDARLATDCGVY